MKTEKIIGNFDCRVWKKDTPKAARQFVPQGERINLSVGFEEAELTDEMREFANLHEKAVSITLTSKYFRNRVRFTPLRLSRLTFRITRKLMVAGLKSLLTSQLSMGLELN